MSTNQTEQPLIQVKHLEKSFGSLKVLKDVTVDIYRGDVVRHRSVRVGKEYFPALLKPSGGAHRRTDFLRGCGYYRQKDRY